MEDMPWVFCGRWFNHLRHGNTCPGTGRCSLGTEHEPHLKLDGTLAPYWCFGHRIRLYREGKPTTDDRMLRATTWKPGVIPVLSKRREGADPEVVGAVIDVQREPDTGWVTGMFLADRFQATGLAAEATFDSPSEMEVVQVRGRDISVLNGARLISVHLGVTPTWAEMEVPW